jgi:two-component system capsular synthesis response regulator RcsB
VLTERWSTNEICRALMSTTLRAVCVGPRPVPYASTIPVIDAVKDSTAFSAALDHLPCDVVVSDYVIPRGDYGDGLPLFPLINRRYPNLKIVVLSMLEIPAVALANGYGDALHYEQS